MSARVCERIRVMGFHCDSLGHVNNARYQEFLEQARWTWFAGNALKALLERSGLQLVMVNANLDYLRPAVPGDTVLVDLEISRVGNRSFALRQQILLEGGGDPCLRGEITFALLDPASGRAADMPAQVRTLLERERSGPVTAV